MGAIDVWSQITTERFIQAPWLDTLLRWTGRTERGLARDDHRRDGRR
jgi:uncharacterized protein